MRYGRYVDLPVTARPGETLDTQRDLLVSIDLRGDIFIDTKWFPIRDFNEKMMELGQRSTDRRVVVRADRRLGFGPVRQVLEIGSAAGYREFYLQTDRPNPLQAIGLAMWRVPVQR